MKSSTQMMLWVLMDDLKDAGMLIDYMDEAKAIPNADETVRWLKAKAMARHDALKQDFDLVMARAGIAERVANGDEVAAALHDYLKEEMTKIYSRISRA